MLNLEARHINLIDEILKPYDVTICVYGSRVRGNSNQTSNLDMCVMEDIPESDVRQIKESFSESNLPITVDLSLYSKFDYAFKEAIQPDLMIYKTHAKSPPNPNITFPLRGIKRLCFLKNIVKNPLIQVGDYTYYDDPEDVFNFHKNVLYHFDFIGDRLEIGSHCQIATGVKFIMNGANHAMNEGPTFPYGIFGGSWSGRPIQGENKGNTVIGDHVWVGYNAVIMPGVNIGQGAIIGACSVVTKNVEPFGIVAGNPAREIGKRENYKTDD